MNRAQATLVAIALAGVGAFAFAQMPPDAPPPHQKVDIAELLDLDATKAAQVQAILDASHQKMRAAMEAIRADTETQLATVLTPEQLAKLKATMPAPGVRRRAT
ncbi:MAG: hypothetical protein ACM3X5_04800 [Bacillota bacterium]